MASFASSRSRNYGNCLMLSKSVYVHSAWLRLRCGHIEIQQMVGNQPGPGPGGTSVPQMVSWRWHDGLHKGCYDFLPAPLAKVRISDTKPDTTLSDRVQASKLHDDPWEGSGAMPCSVGTPLLSRSADLRSK